MTVMPGHPGRACARPSAGPVPGIHVFGITKQKTVDGRDKPGHDETIVAREFFPA